MGILSTEVEVTISNNVKYYESLGYEIPKYYNVNNNKYLVKKGTKILVKVSDLPINSHTLVDVECDNCKSCYKTEYRTYLKFLHDNNIIYCHKCACNLFNSGCNHYKWNINKTETERVLQRHSIDYTRFIQKVLARDNYTCQCCKKGKKECILEVHHLDGYDWCKEKRTDDTNGITLCNVCHKNFHSLYGRGNNTKRQFEEWFNTSITLISYDIELPQARQIYCIEEDKIYYSANDLATQWNLKGTNAIYNVCNQVISSYRYKTKDGGIKTNYVKNYTVKGKHLIWYDKYINMTQEELNLYVEANNYIPYTRKVICITTGQVFDSAISARQYYNSKINISGCCKGKAKSAGKSQDGIPLVWMYYDDYLNQQVDTD